jgi:hypothetical protein
VKGKQLLLLKTREIWNKDPINIWHKNPGSPQFLMGFLYHISLIFRNNNCSLHKNPGSPQFLIGFLFHISTLTTGVNLGSFEGEAVITSKN